MSTIIFDGDDTLWELQPLDDRAMDAFSLLLQKELGTSPEKTRQELIQIDASHVEKFGFGELRFRHSMLSLYERLCLELKQPAIADVKTQISNIAVTVSTVAPKPMDGARDVLAELCLRRRLLLYSGGAKELQVQKLQNLGLDIFFRHMYFCGTKNVANLERIVSENRLLPRTTWMVGNSLRCSSFNLI